MYDGGPRAVLGEICPAWQPCGSQAKRFILEHRLGNSVVFPRAVATTAHKYSLYEEADTFVLPGIQQEGQPLVALEAMAAGSLVLS